MKAYRFLLCIVVMFAGACTTPDVQVTEDRIASENEALIRRVLERIDQRKLDAAFELYAEDYVDRGPGEMEVRGRDGIRGLWAAFLQAFPDLTSTVDDVVTQGDKLVLRWTIKGTHTGEFLGVPATNRKIILPVIEIFRIADGQLVEAWDQWDRLHLMQQIGAIPESAWPG